MLSGSCSEAEVAAIVEAVPNLLDPQVGGVAAGAGGACVGRDASPVQTRGFTLNPLIQTTAVPPPCSGYWYIFLGPPAGPGAVSGQPAPLVHQPGPH